PAGKYTITVERGKEYFPLTRQIEIGDKPVEESFKLRRWIDLPDRGWHSGDTHVHRTLDELPNLLMAEDYTAPAVTSLPNPTNLMPCVQCRTRRCGWNASWRRISSIRCSLPGAACTWCPTARPPSRDTGSCAWHWPSGNAGPWDEWCWAAIVIASIISGQVIGWPACPSAHGRVQGIR